MNNITTLYLVRHGQSILNTENVVQGVRNDSHNHLTPEGRTQAEMVARELASIPFIACYASPHVRTQETAHILLGMHQIPFVIEQQLQEKRQGSMTGMTKKDFFARYKGWDSMTEDERLHIKLVPDEESQAELWKRAKQVLLTIASSHHNRCVLVVTHGGLMRSVYQHIMGIPFTQMWSFHNCGYMAITMANGCMEIIHTSGLHQKDVADFLK